MAISQQTIDRLNALKSSDKFSSLAPETQSRIDKLISSYSPAPKSSKAEEPGVNNPIMRAMIGLNKGMMSLPGYSAIMPQELKEYVENAPKADSFVNKVSEGVGQAVPTVMAMSPFVKGAGAVVGAAKFIPQIARGSAALGLGSAAFEGTKKALERKPEEIIPAAGQGLVGGALMGAAGQAGSQVMSRLAPAMKYGANIGTATGQGAYGYLTAPEGEKEAQAAIGAGMGLIAPMSPVNKSYEQRINDYAKVYRNVLAPSKGDVSRVEIQSGKNIDDYYKLAAKEGLVIKASQDNKLDTAQAREDLAVKRQPLIDEAAKIIASNKQKIFNLNELKSQTIPQLRKNFKNDLDYNNAIKILNKEINAAVKEHGNKVDAQTLNNIKQGMWEKGYDQLNPSAKPTAREIGNVAKNMIEKAYPSENIKGINKKLGDLYTLDAILESAHGRVIQKGKLGRYFAQGIGAVAGAPLPYVGPMVGGYVGGKVSDIMTSPERITGDISKKVSKLTPPAEKGFVPSYTPELVERNIPTDMPIGITNQQKLIGREYNPIMESVSPQNKPIVTPPPEVQGKTIYGENPIKRIPAMSIIGQSPKTVSGEGLLGSAKQKQANEPILNPFNPLNKPSELKSGLAGKKGSAYIGGWPVEKLQNQIEYYKSLKNTNDYKNDKGYAKDIDDMITKLSDVIKIKQSSGGALGLNMALGLGLAAGISAFPGSAEARKLTANELKDKDIYNILWAEAANDKEGWIAKLNTYEKARRKGETLGDAMRRVSSAYRNKSNQYKIARSGQFSPYEKKLYNELQDTVRKFNSDENWTRTQHENPNIKIKGKYLYPGDTEKERIQSMIKALDKVWSYDRNSGIKIGKEIYFKPKKETRR